MPVIKLKYTNQEGSSIQVTTDTGEYSAPWPCHTWNAQEIQEAIDAGMAIEPFKTDTELALEAKQARAGVILDRLNEIDLLSVRPLRAKIAGVATQFDTDKLASLNSDAAALRAELKTLAV